MISCRQACSTFLPLRSRHSCPMACCSSPRLRSGRAYRNHDVTVQVRVLEGYEQLTNHALVSADGATPATASVKTTVFHPWGELLLDKVGPTAALTNTPIVYVLTCRNPSAVT